MASLIVPQNFAASIEKALRDNLPGCSLDKPDILKIGVSFSQPEEVEWEDVLLSVVDVAKQKIPAHQNFSRNPAGFQISSVTAEAVANDLLSVSVCFGV